MYVLRPIEMKISALLRACLKSWYAFSWLNKGMLIRSIVACIVEAYLNIFAKAHRDS